MVALLPEEIRCRLRKHPELDKLMEVVMDLGRTPLARFPSGDYELSDCPITFQDLEFATSQVLLIHSYIVFRKKLCKYRNYYCLFWLCYESGRS